MKLNKEKLVKAIKESPNFYGEIQKLVNYKNIDYNDLLTIEEQKNLESLFDSDIISCSDINLEDSEYPRFPLFFILQEILDKNNIKLDGYNLENDEVRLELLDQLFNIVKDNLEISIFMPRILFEIYIALFKIFKSSEELNKLFSYTESFLNLMGDLYEKTEHDLFYKYYQSLLRIISKDYKEMNRFEDLTIAFDRFSKFFNSRIQNDEETTIYLIYLSILYENLVLNNKNDESNKYLKEFVNFLQRYQLRDYHPFPPIGKGLASISPVMLELKPNEKTKELLNDLILIVKDLLQDLNNFPIQLNNLYLILALIYSALDDFDNVKKYLIKEANNVRENRINRDIFNYYEILDLNIWLTERMDLNEKKQYLKDVYNYNPIKDFVLHISNDQFSSNDLMFNESKKYIKDHLRNLNESNKEEVSESEDEFSDYDGYAYMTAHLTLLELEIAQNNLNFGEFREAFDQTLNVEKQIETLSSQNVPELVARFSYENELIKQAVNLINEDISLTEFISLLEANVAIITQYKNSEKFINPLIPLINVSSVIFNNISNVEALILLKKIYEIGLSFPDDTRNIQYIDSFIQLLAKLRKTLEDEETIIWTDEVLNEYLNKLIELKASPEEYIRNLIYLKKAQELSFEESNEIINTFSKVINYLELYPDGESVEIKDQIGHSYLEIGIAQRLNGDNEKAVESLNKALKYLGDHSANLFNYLHFIDLFRTYNNLAEFYLMNKDYDKVDSVAKKARQIFKKNVRNINDSFLFEIYLNSLNYLFIACEYLKNYNEQEEILKEIIALIDKKNIQFESFSKIFPVLASFNNLNMDREKYVKKWNWRDYIDEIITKLMEIDIYDLMKDYDLETKDGILNLFFDYKEKNEEMDIDLPRDFLLNSFYLSQELPEESSANQKLNSKHEKEKIRYHD